MPTPGERFDRMSAGMAYKPSSRALDPREVIIERGWNARTMSSSETKEHIKNLKISILSRVNSDPPLPGLFEPIKVRYNRQTGEVTLVDGECRLTACRELWDEGHEIYVPSVVVEGTDEQLIASSLLGNGGLPLTQWELGTKYHRLQVGYSWSIEKIAANTGKSKKYVTESITLANSPAEIKEMIAAGEITPARVRREVWQHGPNAVEAIKAAIKDAASEAETAQVASETTKTRKPAPLTRAKAPSAKDEKTEHLLSLADSIAKMILDDDTLIPDVQAVAKKYLKARGE